MKKYKKTRKKIKNFKRKKKSKKINSKSIKKKKIKKISRLSKKIYKTKKFKKKSFAVNSKSLFIKFIRFQEKFSFGKKISFNLLTVDKYIENFFNKIENKIKEYQSIKLEERKRIRLEKIEKQEKEKIFIEEQKKKEKELQFKLKQKFLKEEEKLEKERNKDIKLFLRKEQAILRKEQTERQKKFLQELKIDQQIEKFRIREIKELAKLEKISLAEKREDYIGLQERINKLKEKYRLLRNQKIRERVEALGVKTLEGDDRETLLLKEKEYYLARQKIEMALESFYRSASSLVFQLNKRHLTREMSIFRCIDRRFETGEIFIKWDDAPDNEWLILIYIKDNSPDKGIVVEDKADPEKNLSQEFKSSEIFKASDYMVDSLTQLVAKVRSKKKN